MSAENGRTIGRRDQLSLAESFEIITEYDEIGRISTEKALAKNQKMCYTYDEQSRVVKRTVISLSGTTETEEVFSYDGAGNVTADSNHILLCSIL